MSKRLALFDKLIAEGSQDPFHHYARALELRSLSRDADAYAALVAVTKQFPDYVPSYLIAAQLAQQVGEADEARALAEQGIASAKRAGNEHALSELSSFLEAL